MNTPALDVIDEAPYGITTCDFLPENVNIKSVLPCLAWPQRGPWSCGEAQRSQRVAARPQVKSASGPATTLTDELLAKEEQYK